jgi:hypothetical protein
MPANTDPIFTRIGMKGSVLVTAANTSSQGGGTIGTDIFLAATCDATNGSFIQRVRWIPTATAATTTTATVGRVFLSTVASGATTSANTWLWQEVALAPIAADNATASVIFFDIVLGFAIPSGTQTILVTNHAAPAANTAWRAVVIGGDY